MRLFFRVTGELALRPASSASLRVDMLPEFVWRNGRQAWKVRFIFVVFLNQSKHCAAAVTLRFPSFSNNLIFVACLERLLNATRSLFHHTFSKTFQHLWFDQFGAPS